MIALVVLVVLALWCLVAFLLTSAIAREFPKRWWRWPATGLVFCTVFLLPVADELVGRRQFEALCKANAVMQVDPLTARGRTVYAAPAEFTPVGGTWVAVSFLPVRYVDASTGETVVGFRDFRANGGLLAQAVGLNGGGAPLTFGGSCSPAARGRLDTLFKQLQITSIRRPKHASGKFNGAMRRAPHHAARERPGK